MNNFLFRFCAVAALVFGVSSAVKAAPVTFAFEAVVDQVIGNADGLVQVTPGDSIRGIFTYEPTLSGARSQQVNEIRFEVNGLTLASAAYEIILDNDAALPTTTPVFPGTFDTASIACSFFSENECTPGNIPGENGWKWNPFINFSGNFGILDNEELSNDLNWNGFGNRDLQLRLENLSSSSGLTIQATIGPLTLVPEPSAVFLAIMGSALALLAQSQKMRV